MTELTTSRLLLRDWRDSDLEPFAVMNADPEVMRHFPAPLTRAESDALAGRVRAELASRGYGLWALEHQGTAEFLGFTGLQHPRFEVPWMADRPQPVVEVGWRLRREAWGQGYATEAAGAAVRHGFGTLGLREIVSFTVVENHRSQAVMRRLGMRLLASYDHPVPDGPPLPSVVFVLPAGAAEI